MLKDDLEITDPEEDKMKYITIEDKTNFDESTYFNEDVKVFTDQENPFQKHRNSKVLQIYTPNRNERVLDLGCGFETFCFAVAHLCREVIGLDSSRENTDLSNKLLAKSQYNNIKFVCSDAQDTQLESESFDVIICTHLFEYQYLKIFEKVLDECRRILKKEGKLIIWTPYRFHILEFLKNNNIIFKGDTSHVDYKSMSYLLKALIKRYFLIKKSYYTESHIPILCSLEKLLLQSLPIMRRHIAILAERIN